MHLTDCLSGHESVLSIACQGIERCVRCGRDHVVIVIADAGKIHDVRREYVRLGDGKEPAQRLQAFEHVVEVIRLRGERAVLECRGVNRIVFGDGVIHTPGVEILGDHRRGGEVPGSSIASDRPVWHRKELQIRRYQCVDRSLLEARCACRRFGPSDSGKAPCTLSARGRLRALQPPETRIGARDSIRHG